MKYRTGFVTNSSSASYSVAIKIEDRKNRSFEMDVSTYSGYPYYKDTTDGCDIHPEGSMSLSYQVPYAFERENPLDSPSLASLRKLSQLLLDSITIHGYGYSYDWWRTKQSEEYFYNHWLRERLAEAAAACIPEFDVVLPKFDYSVYVHELAAKGKVMLDDSTSDYGKRVDNICEGWRFAIAGTPQIYHDRYFLEEYICEHGGAVDSLMGNETDFLILCNNPNDDPFGELFWRDEYKKHDFRWGAWAGDTDDEPGSFEDFLRSFEYPEFLLDKYYESPVDNGYSESWGYVIYNSAFAIPEAEFVRRFDPARERGEGMTVSEAYPLLIIRLEQVCKSRGIDPKELSTVTYRYKVNTFGDSCYELGYYWKDEGVTIDLSNGKIKQRWHKMN